MKWKTFLEIYELELYDLWSRWVYYTDQPIRKPEKVSTVCIKEGERMYDYDEEQIYWEEDEFVDLIDDGFRVTSFKNFMYCAYENMIP